MLFRKTTFQSSVVFVGPFRRWENKTSKMADDTLGTCPLCWCFRPSSGEIAKTTSARPGEEFYPMRRPLSICPAGYGLGPSIWFAAQKSVLRGAANCWQSQFAVEGVYGMGPRPVCFGGKGPASKPEIRGGARGLAVRSAASRDFPAYPIISCSRGGLVPGQFSGELSAPLGRSPATGLLSNMVFHLRPTLREKS